MNIRISVKILLVMSIIILSVCPLFAQDIFDVIRRGNIETVKSIIKNDPEQINKFQYGKYPLEFAAQMRKGGIAEYLVSKGAVINGKNPKALNSVIFALRNNDINMIKMFFSKGADVNYKTWLDETYLHYAALLNRWELAELFINKGINVNVTKRGNLTPLHIASVAGHLEVVKLLVQKGANLNIKSTDGGTPLHFAAAAGHKNITDYLRSNGAEDAKRDFPIYKGKYLGQKRPGAEPECFVPELFLDIYRVHSSPAFSPDGTELYWETIFMQGNNSINRIWCMKMKSGKWQPPEIAPFSKYSSGGPAFSSDGNKLFFFSVRPRNNSSTPAGDPDLWYVERNGDSWGEPLHLGPPVCMDRVAEVYPFVSNDGSLYFTSSGRSGRLISKSALIDGKYTESESLGDLFNSNYVDINKHLEYIMFHSDKRHGNFKHELYISYHKSDGTWSKAEYMGDRLHNGLRATLPSVTSDGKYLFFLRNFSFFWIDAKIIGELKPDNMK